MKRMLVLALNILSIAPFIVLFKLGGNVAIFMLIIWPIIMFINYSCAKSIKGLIGYNCCLAVFSAVGIYICGQLYFKYVQWDSIGEAIVQIEIIVELIYIATITVIECIINKYLDKKSKE